MRSSRPGPAQRGVDVPRMVRRGEHEHALVVGLRAVELRQQLVDDVAARRSGAGGCASGRARRARRGRARTARRGAPPANASCRRRSDSPSHMSSTSLRPSEKKLAPSSPATARARNVLPQPGGPYMQQAAAERLAVVRPQLRVAQRREERGVQARLDLLQAADVVERDPRALRLDQALGVQLREALGDRDRLLRIFGLRPARTEARHGLVRLERRRCRALEAAQDARVRVRARRVAERPRGVAGRHERLRVIRRGLQRRLRVLERPPRVPAHHQQRRQMHPQRGIVRVGDDRRLQSGSH